MYAIAANPLSSSHLMRVVSNVIRTSTYKVASELHQAARAEGFPQPNNIHFWPFSPRLFFSCDQSDRKKHYWDRK